MLGHSDQGAVTGNLVVLNFLCGAHRPRQERRLFLFPPELFGFFDQPFHHYALQAFEFLNTQFDELIYPLNLPWVYSGCALNAAAKRGLDAARAVRGRASDLFLSAVNIG
jgi:hypothetical protein